MNGGIGGDVAGQILDRLDDDVLAKDPSVVVLSFGMNDSRYFDYWNTPEEKVRKEAVAASYASYLWDFGDGIFVDQRNCIVITIKTYVVFSNIISNYQIQFFAHKFSAGMIKQSLGLGGETYCIGFAFKRSNAGNYVGVFHQG